MVWVICTWWPLHSRDAILYLLCFLHFLSANEWIMLLAIRRIIHRLRICYIHCWLGEWTKAVLAAWPLTLAEHRNSLSELVLIITNIPHIISFISILVAFDASPTPSSLVVHGWLFRSFGFCYLIRYSTLNLIVFFKFMLGRSLGTFVATFGFSLTCQLLRSWSRLVRVSRENLLGFPPLRSGFFSGCMAFLSPNL